jgi:hypothetical protein
MSELTAMLTDVASIYIEKGMNSPKDAMRAIIALNPALDNEVFNELFPTAFAIEMICFERDQQKHLERFNDTIARICPLEGSFQCATARAHVAEGSWSSLFTFPARRKSFWNRSQSGWAQTE